MFRVACIVSMVCFSVAPALAAPIDEVQELIEQGNKALESGKIDEAIKHFSAAIGRDKEAEQAFRGRAYAYLKKSDGDKALGDINAAIKINAQEQNDLILPAKIQRLRRDFPAALKDINFLLQQNPEGTGLHQMRGSIYLGMGKLDNAIADFSTSIKLDPENQRGYLERGHVYS